MADDLAQMPKGAKAPNPPISYTERLDRDVGNLVNRYGFPEVVAAIARHANATGRATLFRHLNKIYEWMTKQ